MRSSIGLLALLFGLITSPALSDPIPDDIGSRIVTGFARPATEAFSRAALEARHLVGTLCAAPGGDALVAARAGFRDLVSAWGGVSVLRFGPLQAENRFERVFFWPDPRGVIVRQVQRLLAERDETALSPESLAAKSVALQGLPALELVLHGAGADELETGAGHYRCRYGAAVAANVAAMAAAVAAGWREGNAFHDDFASPSEDHDLYRSDREVAGEVVKAAATALQFTRNAELLPPLGEMAATARGKRAPLWRSDLTFALVAARIDGVLGLLSASGFDADEGARLALETIRFELVHAREAIAKVAAPAEDAFADDVQRGRISYVALALDGANTALGERLSTALGLTMGFNALDGD
jgi:predicted lipoprotein